MYWKNRYYDPRTGRWLNRDPAEENGGSNLYAYCGNDPINQSDPWGTEEVADWIYPIYLSRFGRAYLTSNMNLMRPSDTYTYVDRDKGIMDKRLHIYIWKFYQKYVRKLIDEKKLQLDANWQQVKIPYSYDATNFVPWDLPRSGGIDIHDEGFWLNRPQKIVVEGTFDVRCTGRIEIRRIATIFQWSDTIDSNPSRQDPAGFQLLEGGTAIVEKVFGYPFRAEILWRDNQKEEQPLFP